MLSYPSKDNISLSCNFKDRSMISSTQTDDEKNEYILSPAFEISSSTHPKEIGKAEWQIMEAL